MPQHTDTYALARTNLRQYLRITKGPNQKWRKPKQRRTRDTTKTTQNTTYITTNMITSLPKETYIQKKIESEHQHEKKMTKRTQNPNKKIFSENRNQEKILTPYKNLSYKRSKTTNKKTPKNNQNKQYDRGKSNTNKPYQYNKNKTKMARIRKRNATKNNKNTAQRKQRIRKKKQKTRAITMTTRTNETRNTSSVESDEENHEDTMKTKIKISATSLTAGIKNLRKEIQERNIFIANADAASKILHFDHDWKNSESLFNTKENIEKRKGLFIFPTFTGEHDQV